MITLIWIITILSLIGFWTFALICEEKGKLKNYMSVRRMIKEYESRDRYRALAFSCGIIFGLCVVYLIKYYIGFCGL